MKIRENIDLSGLTTLKVGGPARYFCAVHSVSDLKRAIDFARLKSLRYFVLAGGSNILISDNGFPGLVINIQLKGIDILPALEGNLRIEAMAGESWDDLVAQAVEAGACGLENLSGIPGTCGAAPIQNIGAYGAELGDFLETVEVLDTRNKEIKKMSREECVLGYRDSFFKKEKGNNLIITKICLVAGTNETPNIEYKDLKAHFREQNIFTPTPQDIREAVIRIRFRKFPARRELGSAGSFFKNPVISKSLYHQLSESFPAIPYYESPNKDLVKIPLAWVLDKVCGFKGLRDGKVGLHEDQPLVLVNHGGATEKDIDLFAKKVAHCVRDKTGIEVEREVQTVK